METYITIGIISFVVIGGLMMLYPFYNVWSSRKKGEAALQESLGTQRIQLAEAKARKEAAQLNKESAIIEASAVSAQIDKIGTGLKKHDLFLKWQWIEMMKHKSEGSVIYVPTEAGLPILEAGQKLQRKRGVQEED